MTKAFLWVITTVRDLAKELFTDSWALSLILFFIRPVVEYELLMKYTSRWEKKRNYETCDFYFIFFVLTLVFSLGPVLMLAAMEFWTNGFMALPLTQLSSGQIGI